MNAIVNVSPNWGIGMEGKLLVYVPADLRRFRDLTLGKTIVYGKKTLHTFPDERPLPDRENVILTRDKSFAIEGAVVCHSLEELREFLRDRYSENVFVCGGESVYKQLLPYCDTAYVTFSYTELKADKFFPDLNVKENWLVTEIESTQVEGKVPFRFVTYTNEAPLDLLADKLPKAPGQGGSRRPRRDRRGPQKPKPKE